LRTNLTSFISGSVGSSQSVNDQNASPNPHFFYVKRSPLFEDAVVEAGRLNSINRELARQNVPGGGQPQTAVVSRMMGQEPIAGQRSLGSDLLNIGSKLIGGAASSIFGGATNLMGGDSTSDAPSGGFSIDWLMNPLIGIVKMIFPKLSGFIEMSRFIVDPIVKLVINKIWGVVRWIWNFFKGLIFGNGLGFIKGLLGGNNNAPAPEQAPPQAPYQPAPPQAPYQPAPPNAVAPYQPAPPNAVAPYPAPPAPYYPPNPNAPAYPPYHIQKRSIIAALQTPGPFSLPNIGKTLVSAVVNFAPGLTQRYPMLAVKASQLEGTFQTVLFIKEAILKYLTYLIGKRFPGIATIIDMFFGIWEAIKVPLWPLLRAINNHACKFFRLGLDFFTDLFRGQAVRPNPIAQSVAAHQQKILQMAQYAQSFPQLSPYAQDYPYERFPHIPPYPGLYRRQFY
jgi:hypothetical protein